MQRDISARHRPKKHIGSIVSQCYDHTILLKFSFLLLSVTISHHPPLLLCPSSIVSLILSLWIPHIFPSISLPPSYLHLHLPLSLFSIPLVLFSSPFHPLRFALSLCSLGVVLLQMLSGEGVNPVNSENHITGWVRRGACVKALLDKRYGV